MDRLDTLRVAYLGPAASFSHQAALNVFRTNSNAIIHPVPSFGEIFSALQDSADGSGGEIYDYGVIPVENSTNGSVVQVYDLLVRIPTRYPDLEIIAEYYLEVHHCLFTSPKPSGVDHGHSTEIRTLYTHPQVWGQCSQYLQRHYPRAERIDCSSTSAAAGLVAKDGGGTGGTAAIASRLAGDANGLTCVAENIEDSPGSNTTRFFIIRNHKRRRPNHYQQQQPQPPPLPQDALLARHGQTDAQTPVKYKSMITFTVPHAQPGALADVLAAFAAHDFNLASIDTRPSRQRNWEYVFFVECAETRRPSEPGRLSALLDEVGRRTESSRCLGSWVDMLWAASAEQKQ